VSDESTLVALSSPTYFWRCDKKHGCSCTLKLRLVSYFAFNIVSVHIWGLLDKILIPLKYNIWHCFQSSQHFKHHILWLLMYL